jgi:DNA invertase Pin-like site-specific DNA recombinase
MDHGYARVSTRDQTLASQVELLRQAGVERIWRETASGAVAARPVLDELLAGLRPDDRLTVTRLDRLGRSLPHLLRTVDDLAGRGVHLVSLRERIDTAGAVGRFQLAMFAAMAEFERNLTIERTIEGLVAARASGKRLGRPTVMTDARRQVAAGMAAGGAKVKEIAETLQISRASVYRMLADDGWPPYV